MCWRRRRGPGSRGTAAAGLGRVLARLPPLAHARPAQNHVWAPQRHLLRRVVHARQAVLAYARGRLGGAQQRRRLALLLPSLPRLFAVLLGRVHLDRLAASTLVAWERLGPSWWWWWWCRRCCWCCGWAVCARADRGRGWGWGWSFCGGYGGGCAARSCGGRIGGG